MAASRSGGIPGIAVGLAALGGYFIFVGINDVSFVDGLRQLLTGKTPTGKLHTKIETPQQIHFSAPATGQVGSGIGLDSGAAGSGIGITTLGVKIAETAKKYQGVPYKWGGANPSGWDCSGFVSYVLIECGVKISRMTSFQFLAWGGAQNIPRSNCAAGDLVCYIGHIGIAVDNDNMINAPTMGVPTRIQKIWGIPTIRRVKG